MNFSSSGQIILKKTDECNILISPSVKSYKSYLILEIQNFLARSCFNKPKIYNNNVFKIVISFILIPLIKR